MRVLHAVLSLLLMPLLLLLLHQKVDLEEKGDEFDQLAATLRKVASARLPNKEVSFVIANTKDMASLVERFQVSERAGGCGLC